MKTTKKRRKLRGRRKTDEAAAETTTKKRRKLRGWRKTDGAAAEITTKKRCKLRGQRKTGEAASKDYDKQRQQKTFNAALRMKRTWQLGGRRQPELFQALQITNDNDDNDGCDGR
jgi:hypothetical protein